MNADAREAQRRPVTLRSFGVHLVRLAPTLAMIACISLITRISGGTTILHAAQNERT